MGLLLSLAICLLLVHTLTNGRYGFHRDELATLDDAKHLDWGFVAYPPFTPFVARVALETLGSAPAAVRFFAALAQSVVVVLAGLMAGELGGNRTSHSPWSGHAAPYQLLAAMAVAVSPVSLTAGRVLQYVSFDLLWSVLLFYFVIRLLKSDDPRWWLAVGAAAGLGLMTRYTIAWSIAGLTVGFLLTPARRLLMSRWLVFGALLALLIVSPLLIWQARHAFISIDFLRSIHARDIAWGRTGGFLWKQLVVPAHSFTIPLWFAGAWFYFRRPEGQRYRALGWGFAAALLLFTVTRARDYYSAPLYPMLLAAGAVLSMEWARWARTLTWIGMALAFGLGIAFLLPVAPEGSRWFETLMRANGDLREEIGWPELVDTVANIRDSLPADERAGVGILTANYGEAGAVDLYGGRYRLPPALSVVNSYWLRGYPSPPPRTLILVGFSPQFTETHFATCESKGLISNPYGVPNEESESFKYLWVCQGLREPWPEFWRAIRTWG